MTAVRVSASPDEIVRRYVELVRTDLEPDPLFRRRLRGVVTNRFVAAREGLANAQPRPTHMGKLGRACLYAAFAFAVSVGGTLAASRGAVPGDLLYPVKLQLEAIRLETFPQEFHDDLLAYALGERMAEFGRLVEDGDLARAAGMAETIANGYHELAGMGIHVDSGELPPSFAVLQALSERLPAAAQAAIERAILEAPGLADATLTSSQDDSRAEGGSSAGRPSVMPMDERPVAPVTPSNASSGAPAATAPASARPTERPDHPNGPASGPEAHPGDE